jgi:hypothetical protein
MVSEWWEDALPDVGSEKTNVIWGGNATVNIIPKKYRGLDRFEARKQIIKEQQHYHLAWFQGVWWQPLQFHQSRSLDNAYAKVSLYRRCQNKIRMAGRRIT